MENKEEISKKIKELKESIEESEEEVSDLEDQIEDLERDLDFVKEQTDIINNSVNEKFGNGISWSLYNETYKDGEGGIEEDCVCLYNLKRYSSLSTGEKNMADLEVVKTLQKCYCLNLPIFVDNAETVSSDYEFDGQMIKLIAQKGAKIENLIKIEELY